MRAFRLFLFRLFGFIPRKFPTGGAAALAAYTDTLLEAYGFPNNETFKVAVATMILHYPGKKKHGQELPTDGCAPAMLAKGVRRAMANESAWAVVEAGRQAQQERAAADKKEKANGNQSDGKTGAEAGTAQAQSDQPAGGDPGTVANAGSGSASPQPADQVASGGVAAQAG